MFNHAVDYKLTGTRRESHAIGEFQPFEVFVSHDIDNITPRQAMDSARQSMYNDGFDHILFTHVYLRQDKMWIEIPMLDALGLE